MPLKIWIHSSSQILLKWLQCIIFPLCPEKGAPEQVVISGILPILSLSLRTRGPLTVLTARLVAELAKECELFIYVSSFF